MNVSYDHFLCENCGCSFCVETRINSSCYVVRRVMPEKRYFNGECPSCKCGNSLIIDPAIEEGEI